MLDGVRIALAVARNDIRIHVRYPVEVVNVFIQPLYQSLIPGVLLGATFLVGGRAVGLEASAGTLDVGGFLFVGALGMGPIYAAGWFAAFTFKRDLDVGTLEPQWLAPTSPTTFVVGHAIWGFLINLAGAAVLLVAGVAVFGARLRPEVVFALPALALALIALLGFAYFIASAVLLMKEPGFLVDVATFLLAAASGAYFPLTVLPTELRIVSLALPTTYAIDLLRVFALGTRPLLPVGVEYAALVASALILLPLGRAVFLATERRLRRTGALGHY